MGQDAGPHPGVREPEFRVVACMDDVASAETAAGAEQTNSRMGAPASEWTSWNIGRARGLGASPGQAEGVRWPRLGQGGPPTTRNPEAPPFIVGPQVLVGRFQRDRYEMDTWIETEADAAEDGSTAGRGRCTTSPVPTAESRRRCPSSPTGRGRSTARTASGSDLRGGRNPPEIVRRTEPLSAAPPACGRGLVFFLPASRRSSAIRRLLHLLRSE